MTINTRLASGIQVEFKHQILAIEDDLRKNILDHIYPQKEQCITKLRELQQKKIYPAENYLKSLEELEKVSDEGIARLEARAKPGRGRRMERLANPSKRTG